MRRVRKDEIQRDTWIKPDGMHVCLECWKSWMLADDRDLSASRMQLRGGQDDKEKERVAYEADPYGEQRKADMKVGEAVNAMIDSLKPAMRWSVYRKCGISTVWNFPSIEWMNVLPAALEELEKKLRKNIATAIHFG